VKPDMFVNSLRQTNSIFSSYTQQDAQEFFKFLFSCIQETSSNEMTHQVEIENLFQGTLVRFFFFKKKTLNFEF